MQVFRPFVQIALFMAPVLFGVALPGTSSAQDVRHMCSEKYQAAKAAGTLGEETWPQFYSRCTAEIKASPPAAETAPAPLDVRHICSEKYQSAKAAGTLGGESWPQFYSRCTAETKANPPAAQAAPPAEKAPAAPPPAPVVEAPAPPPPAPVAEAPPPPPPVAPKAPAAVNPIKKPVAKPAAPVAAAPPSAAPATPSAAVFPAAIAPEFASEKPAKARMKTCAAQWKANKATNANGGMKWSPKGGGYMSECIKRLKE